ncbi:dickkopf-like protein 1 isoform X2 [Monodelphis domestica]|uniref:dickkopf-like protein 1 isoform X2 n=1 Tax=Monodelphis domestica TaxID=13616 RepID=UPI0024E236BD|nr:dickkopf-like protein 1 isoform X2 [Monodelphis domestica]
MGTQSPWVLEGPDVGFRTPFPSLLCSSRVTASRRSGSSGGGGSTAEGAWRGTGPGGCAWSGGGFSRSAARVCGVSHRPRPAMWPQPLLMLLLLLAATPEDQAAPVSILEHARGHSHSVGGPDTSEGPELGPMGLLGIHSLFRSLNRLLFREDLLRGMDTLTPSLDLRSLPSNYHKEDQKQGHLGNSTVYSHHQIDKAPEDEENELPQALPSSGLSSFRAETQPRVSFWIIKLPHRMGQVESQPGSGWLSEKRHRLQAIRDGLREGAHEEAPFRFHPRRAHFFYLLKPPRKL